MMRAADVRAAVVAVLLVASHAGAVRAAPRAIVLVTVDTMRADHLGLYGQPLPVSPALDALAAESVVFDRALSTCPATAPSVAAMLTGHHRATNGVVRNGASLPADVTTLAEVLRAAGFRTGAVVANQLLHRAGFKQGFERFTLAQPDAARPELFRDAPLLKAAGRLLREFVDDPFFLWVHLMAPHGPYQPPRRYLPLMPAQAFRRPGDRTLMVSFGNRGPGLVPRYQNLGGPVIPAEYRRRYAAEIRYVDDLLGALVGRLRRLGRWEDALVVVTADHGESLGEHDLWFQHGWYVYDDTVRVPLLVRAPNGTLAPRRVGASVSLVDLMPTVLDLTGVASPAGLEGESLLPLMQGDATDRTAYAQNYYENALVASSVGRWKYVRRGKPQREELYDTAVDPGETRNLGGEHPEVLRRFAEQTTAWLDDQRRRTEAMRGRRVTLPVPPEKAKALRALGYAD
jgi:arylsulfatase A-like enzyme